MSASADVLAQAKVEIDLSLIPEGKNVSSRIVHVTTDVTLIIHRLLLSGAGNPSSSDTVPPTKSKKPKTHPGKNYGTLNPTQTASRSLNG